MTKTEQVVLHYKRKEYRKAIAIASKFRRLTIARSDIFKNAHSAYTNPRSYLQLKGQAWIEEVVSVAVVELSKFVQEYNESTGGVER